MRGRTVKRVLVVVLVAAAAALLIAPGRIIRTAVETGGSLAMGVPVRLGGAAIRWLKAEIDLKGLEVGNPEGYRTKSAVEAGRIIVRAPLHRLVGSRPRIESVVIEEPAVTLEQGLTASNLSDLMANASKPAARGAGKKVVIGLLRITGAKMTFVAGMKGAVPATIPLPPIELRELGGEGNQGVTIAQTMSIALQELVKSGVANGAGIIPADLGASLSSGVDSLNKAGGQVVGAAADAGGKAAGAAADAGGKAVEAAKGTAKGIFGSAKGLADKAGAAIPAKK